MKVESVPGLIGLHAERQHIKSQVEAEAAFGEYLERRGVDPVLFMKQWNLSHHQFNTLAHYLHGVNDEEPNLPPSLEAVLFALEKPRAA